MTRFSPLIAVATAFIAWSSGQMAAAHDGIRIEAPYARVVAASAKSGAVYMTLTNHSKNADRLVSVRTDAAERADLHSNSQDANGVMRMVKMDGGLPLKAMATRTLDRAGDHIMLFGLTRAINPGDVLTLTLTFESAGEMTIEVPVENDRAPAAMDHSGHTMPATE